MRNNQKGHDAPKKSRFANKTGERHGISNMFQHGDGRHFEFENFKYLVT